MTKIFVFILLLVALPLFSFGESPQLQCEKQGGRWEGTIHGRGRLTGCNMPTSDANKNCKRGEDCESVCLKDGKCYGWKMYKGCGFYKGDDKAMCYE